MAEPAGTDGPSWRALVEASTDGLWLLDVDGTTAWANRRLGELLGRGDDDLVGLPAPEAFAPEARARVVRHLSLLTRATRGRDNVPMQLQRADGTLVPVLVSYAPVREDAAPVRWLHRLTPAPADHVATYQGFLDTIHPDDREMVQERVLATFEGAEELAFDARVLRPSGEVRWTHGRGRVVRDPATGRPVRMSGTTADVTALYRHQEVAAEATGRIRLLQELAVAANNATTLEEAVEVVGASLVEHTDWSPVAGYRVDADDEPLRRLDLPIPPACPPDGDLAERARDAAMEASRLKSEFLATMSHEIRTAMTGVIGLNELLLRTELDDHQHRLAAGVQSAGLSLLAIINDILDLSKIESGKLELEDVDFDVRSVFEQTAAVLSGPAHEKDLELVVSCHPGVPELLRGDPTRLGQVLTNLGSNAVKFTERGEVAIRARVERSDSDGVLLRVEVTDTGLGIAPEAQAGLFDAFTQADLSTTRRHGGTGLGLAISQQLVEAMQGCIRVDSEPGRGSTFSFTALLEHTSVAPRRAATRPQPLRDERVLVVDDNETSRFILTEQLASWHVRPLAVATPAEALVVLREAHAAGEPFTVALLDLVLPRIDGLELARMIHSDPDLAGLKMLLLTSDQAVSTRSARAAGVSTTLNKPVRHAELYDALVAATGRGGEPAPRSLRRVVVPSLDLAVLVVEDNPVNQLVATGLLESLGLHVDVADDGLGAVEALRDGHDYALVLMDCRLPEMDGFKATEVIRAREKTGRRVPIIAMTASALEGEREHCLQVGMDDFLTKPVDPTALEEVVRRWTRPQEQGVAEAAAPEPSTPEPEPAPAPAPAPAMDAAVEDAPDDVSGPAVVDHERRRVLDELVKDGQSFFDRTARSFSNRIDEQVAAIRDAVDARDANRAFTASHLVKGSALNLGLPRVSAVAAALEAHAHAGRTDEADPLLVELEAEVARAVDELARLVRP